MTMQPPAIPASSSNSKNHSLAGNPYLSQLDFQKQQVPKAHRCQKSVGTTNLPHKGCCSAGGGGNVGKNDKWQNCVGAERHRERLKPTPC